MNLQNITKIIIFIHASLGGLALISGLVAMIAKKGSSLHKKSGKLFFYTMISSTGIALIVSCLPKHENSFLFSIGIFTIYLTITGFLALRYKKIGINLKLDKGLSLVMLLTGILMIIYPIFQYQKINIVLSVFGLIGILLAFFDLRFYQNLEELKSRWLRLHIIKMIAAYIASFTAFIVVTQIIPGLAGWLLPMVLGTSFIIFWVRKIKSTKV